MAMEATTIRFEAEEKSWIQAYADLAGMTFSEVVRKAALSMVEDAVDVQAYAEAISDDDGTRLSMEDVRRLAMSAE